MNNAIGDHLERELADLPEGPICVGFSGGLDSTVLLHLLANSTFARKRGLSAIHIDHGLHTDSARWAEHCDDVATASAIELRCVSVDVPAASGIGREAAARRARYAVFGEQLADGGIIGLAHHRDDQAETILLKLLRAAGPQGLGGMRTLRPLDRGFLWRPLLPFARTELLAYATEHDLCWIDDSSNADVSFDRNYLRSEILPRLRERWPQTDAALARSATWLRAAAAFVDDAARSEIAGVRGVDPATLQWRAWLDLPDALRDPVLRLWLREVQLPEPTHLQVAEIERQLRDAAIDRLPCVRWSGCELHRYRELLYALAPQIDPPTGWSAEFDGSPLQLPGDIGAISLVSRDDLEATVHAPGFLVRFRHGGESLRLPDDVHTSELRKLFQEAGVPPWQRGRIPLLYRDDVLLAAGDRWIGGAAAELFEQHRCRLHWQRGDTRAH